MKKRLFATLLALVMALGLTVTAAADETETYVDKDGNPQSFPASYTTVTDSGSTVIWGADGQTTWYVVKGDVRIEPHSPTQIENYHYAAVKSSGTVNLILCDGATLTVTVKLNLGDQLSGIYSTGSLTIYGQSEGTGQLVVEARGHSGEGIGNDGMLTINGGNVTAKGDVTGIRNSSTLTINGGKLTATGTASYSAGIYNNKSNSTVKINGGTVIASGRSDFSNIYGGSVNLPTTAYWWRTAETGAYTKFVDDTTAYTPGSETYAEITTTEPVVTPPADEPEPEPKQEPSAPAHEPIRRQNTTAVEDTADTADTTKTDEAKTDTVTSAKTFDAGVAVYGAMAALSLTGTAWVARKKS